MTVIIGVAHAGKVWVGADSAASDNSCSRVTRRDVKVFRRDSCLIGFCGSFRIGQLVRHSLKLTPCAAQMDSAEYMVCRFIPALRRCLTAGGAQREKDGVVSMGGTDLLVGHRGRVFVVYEDLQVQENACGFDAIGIAAEYALGSLASTIDRAARPEWRVRRALEVSAQFSGHVLPPFLIEQLG
jgi:ATP-dependent protease HslVU (ClpYQ) peptidase subunit